MRISIVEFNYERTPYLHIVADTCITKMATNDDELVIEVLLTCESLNVRAEIFMKFEDQSKIDPKITGRGLLVMMDTFMRFVRTFMFVISPWLDLGHAKLHMKEWYEKYRELVQTNNPNHEPNEKEGENAISE